MRFIIGEGPRGMGVHLLSAQGAQNLTACDPSLGTDLAELIGTRPNLEFLTDTAAGAPFEDPSAIKPALPVAKPGKIICLGLNYVDHIKEGGYEIPKYPALFMRGLTSMIPAAAPMVRPACSERLDYEAELMVIIGRRGKHVSDDSALDLVFGYTLFNDGSVRDYQRKTHQWTPGKNFDATGPVGPVVVTPDELPPGAAGLKIESRINGEVMQSANTSDMLWNVARTISTLSEFATLEPGDMIAMGTPPGVGHARRPPRWLRPGDTVEIEIEGIGICSNPVVAEEELPGFSGAG